MLKNILAKLGSKKVAGAILVMATLLVGIGVISNFSDDQKIANDAALSRFKDNAFNNFNNDTANRAALERQMYAQQDKNTARFLQGKNNQYGMDEDDAFSSDGAYAEGVRSDEGFVYGDGSAYDPSNPRYVAGTYDENGNLVMDGSGSFNRAMQGGAYSAGADSSESANDEAGASSAKDKNKGAKGKNKIKNTPQTQLNRLAASSGSSAYGSSGGSGSGFSGGSANINTGAFRDSNTRALPQNNTQIAENDINVKAFRNGRGGAMGGMNVARSSGGLSDTGKGTRGNGAASDLQIATAYSGKAIASDAEARAKMLAQAAFDGSNPEEIGATIESGATIQKVANELMGGNTSNSLPNGFNNGMQQIKEELDNLQNQQEKLSQLQKDLTKRYLQLLLGTIGFFTAIAILVACNNVYTTIAAGVLTGVAALFIAAQLWGGDWGIFDIIRKMGSDELSGVNQGINLQGKKIIAGAAGVLCGVIIGLAWTKAVTKVIKTIGKFFKTIGQRIAQTFKNLTGGIEDILKAIRGFVGK